MLSKTCVCTVSPKGSWEIIPCTPVLCRGTVAGSTPVPGLSALCSVSGLPTQASPLLRREPFGSYSAPSLSDFPPAFKET